MIKEYFKLKIFTNGFVICKIDIKKCWRQTIKLRMILIRDKKDISKENKNIERILKNYRLN